MSRSFWVKQSNLHGLHPGLCHRDTLRVVIQAHRLAAHSFRGHQGRPGAHERVQDDVARPGPDGDQVGHEFDRLHRRVSVAVRQAGTRHRAFTGTGKILAVPGLMLGEGPAPLILLRFAGLGDDQEREGLAHGLRQGLPPSVQVKVAGEGALIRGAGLESNLALRKKRDIILDIPLGLCYIDTQS